MWDYLLCRVTFDPLCTLMSVSREGRSGMTGGRSGTPPTSSFPSESNETTRGGLTNWVEDTVYITRQRS